jgi:hypothetical protein
MTLEEQTAEQAATIDAQNKTIAEQKIEIIGLTQRLEEKLDKIAQGKFAREFVINGQKYVYDYDKLPFNLETKGITAFQTYEKLYNNLPRTTDELNQIIVNNSLLLGFENILMKDDNGKLTNEGVHEALTLLTSGEDKRKLRECQGNFYLNTGITSNASMQQLSNAMTLLEGLQKLGGSSDLVLELIKEGIKNPQPNVNAENITSSTLIPNTEEPVITS